VGNFEIGSNHCLSQERLHNPKRPISPKLGVISNTLDRLRHTLDVLKGLSVVSYQNAHGIPNLTGPDFRKPRLVFEIRCHCVLTHDALQPSTTTVGTLSPVPFAVAAFLPGWRRYSG
jgi:hypothetical protein